MLCLNSVSIEVEKMVKGKKWFSDGTLGYIAFSNTQSTAVCGSCGAGGTGRPLRINGRTDPIASWAVVANVEPIIGKLWSKNLNK
jgi:hypothetical protein